MSTTVVNMHLKPYFERLGFTEKEAAVYLTLAELGKGTAQTVGKRCRMPRTTAYFTLQSLSERGVVVEERKKKTTYFSPRPANVLRELVKQEEEEVRQRAAAAEELSNLLQPFFRSKLYSVPTMHFVEGKPAVEEMLRSSLPEWIASMRELDQTWWGYQSSEFVVEYRSFLESYWKIKEPGQRVLLFSNESDAERSIRIANRTIHVLPPEFQLESTIWICGEYLIVVMHKNRPQYAFQVKDRLLAANLSVIFRLLWSSRTEVG